MLMNKLNKYIENLNKHEPYEPILKAYIHKVHTLYKERTDVISNKTRQKLNSICVRFMSSFDP